MCELTAETFECEICNVAFSLQSHIQTFDSFKSETDVGEFLTEVIVTMPLVNLLSSYVRCVMWHLCCVPFHSYFQVGSRGACRIPSFPLGNTTFPTSGTIFPTGNSLSTSFRAQWNAALVNKITYRLLTVLNQKLM